MSVFHEFVKPVFIRLENSYNVEEEIKHTSNEKEYLDGKFT